MIPLSRSFRRCTALGLSVAAASAGAGTTILQVDPSTGTTGVFFQGAPVAGPVGIAINPANDGAWIGDYGGATDGSAANDLLISSAGRG